jgi:hypothetical protein
MAFLPSGTSVDSMGGQSTKLTPFNSNQNTGGRTGGGSEKGSDDRFGGKASLKDKSKGFDEAFSGNYNFQHPPIDSSFVVGMYSGGRETS